MERFHGSVDASKEPLFCLNRLRLVFCWIATWYQVLMSCEAKLIENHCSKQLRHQLSSAFRRPPLKWLVVFLHFEFASALLPAFVPVLNTCTPVVLRGPCAQQDLWGSLQFPIITSRCFGLDSGVSLSAWKTLWLCALVWKSEARMQRLHLCIHALTVNSSSYRG